MFGLTRRETAFLKRLSPPWRIQRFLDACAYDVKGSGCRSPRRVLRERRVQCMDGALFAAAALRVQGHPPLLVDLEAVQDDDHVLAVFRERRRWGAVARSNYSGLRYREPVHDTLRSLVVNRFNGNGVRSGTLRKRGHSSIPEIENVSGAVRVREARVESRAHAHRVLPLRE